VQTESEARLHLKVTGSKSGTIFNLQKYCYIDPATRSQKMAENNKWHTPDPQHDRNPSDKIQANPKICR
jgi:hypothetical protein